MKDKTYLLLELSVPFFDENFKFMILATLLSSIIYGFQVHMHSLNEVTIKKCV